MSTIGFSFLLHNMVALNVLWWNLKFMPFFWILLANIVHNIYEHFGNFKLVEKYKNVSVFLGPEKEPGV